MGSARLFPQKAWACVQGMLSFVYTFTTAFVRTVSVFICIVCVLVLHFNPAIKYVKMIWQVLILISLVRGNYFP